MGELGKRAAAPPQAEIEGVMLSFGPPPKRYMLLHISCGATIIQEYMYALYSQKLLRPVCNLFVH